MRVVVVERSDVTYVLVLEGMRLLLVCASTQLYTTQVVGPPDAHPFLEVLMDQEQSAVPVIRVLLHMVISRPPLAAAKTLLYSPPHDPGPVVLRLFRAAAGKGFESSGFRAWFNWPPQVA